MSKETGGSAYPTYFTADHAISMTLRDHFAAKAMQAMMARISTHEAAFIAHDAYIVADAMLKERKK